MQEHIQGSNTDTVADEGWAGYLLYMFLMTPDILESPSQEDQELSS